MNKKPIVTPANNALMPKKVLEQYTADIDNVVPFSPKEKGNMLELTQEETPKEDFDMSNEQLLNQRVEQLEKEFDRKLEHQSQLLDAKMENLTQKLDSKFETINDKIDSKFELISQKIEDGFKQQKLENEIYLNTKFNEQEKANQQRVKENRTFSWTVAGAVGTITSVVVSIIIFFITK